MLEQVERYRWALVRTDHIPRRSRMREMLLSRWFRISNSTELESRSRFLKDWGKDRMKYIANYFRSYIKFYKSTMVVDGLWMYSKLWAFHNKYRICMVQSYHSKAIWKETMMLGTRSLGHRTYFQLFLPTSHLTHLRVPPLIPDLQKSSENPVLWAPLTLYSF